MRSVDVPRPTRLKDPDTHVAVRDLRQAVEDVSKSSILDGVLLTTTDRNAVATDDHITITVGTTTKLKHGLGRRLKGWFIVDLVSASTAAGSVFRVTTDADDTKDLWLSAVGYSTTIKVRVWVF